LILMLAATNSFDTRIQVRTQLDALAQKSSHGKPPYLLFDTMRYVEYSTVADRGRLVEGCQPSNPEFVVS
jgi:hypothetical protein